MNSAELADLDPGAASRRLFNFSKWTHAFSSGQVQPLVTHRFPLISGLLILVAAALTFTPPLFASPDFVSDVRPILERSCFGCHGPDKQKSGYRLDVRDIAIKGGDSGEVAIAPHAAKKSPLIRYVSGEDEKMLMPPKKSNKPRLSAAEVETLRAWIDAGPSWPDEFAGPKGEGKPHWSLTPLLKPKVPVFSRSVIRHQSKSISRARDAGALNTGSLLTDYSNPIDAFVRAKLVEKNLAHSPEADRRTLIRRVSYDLTGLPPTPEEVAAFIADKDKRAYEKLVARLLASPRHGEHWARHWLDVANYADTHGNDHDYARPNAWPYRDYVIRAFNDDKPYAHFVQEQVAGDALFPDDPQATVALGFLAAGPWDHTLMVTVREDTVDHRSAQNLDRDSMVSTAMGTFQSLTVHCARCHNHKFDPITQREYYSLQAVFAGVDRANRPFDVDSHTQAKRSRLSAEKRALQHLDPALLTTLGTPEVTQKVAAWEKAWTRREEAWAPLEIVSVVSTGGASLTRQSDGSWFASGPRPERDTYIVTARWRPGKISAMRLEVLPDDRLPQRGPGRWDNGNFHLSEFRAFATPPVSGEGAKPLVFARATADYDEGPAISAAQAIDGKNETQWGVHPRYGEPHEAVFEVKDPPVFPEGTTFTLLLENQAGATGHGIGRFRLSASDAAPTTAPLAPLAAELTAILRVPAGERTPAQLQELALAVLKMDNQGALAALPAPQFVYAVTRDFPADGDNFKPSPQPRPIHLLTRGELSKPGELVSPGTLGCVPEMPHELAIASASDESARRAALALWLTDERNALTWRSIVNRIWSYHFGRGLCDTPNDFGKMGGAPSHLELLDWLAVWFRDEAKGSLKALHQLIVTSETWKQTSLAHHGATSDGDNRLLWRQNRPRLSGEQVRDTLLTLSDKLDLTMGGSPAVQFISRGDATFMSGGNPAFLDYEHFDPDAPAARRRAIYRFLFRTVPDPFMDALDCPDGSTFTPVRGVSTTAVQAFVMMNDAFLIRQCEHIAARLAAQGSTLPAQAEAAFQLILLRGGNEGERAKFADYIQHHGLANACQLLLNSNEFLYLD
ncbi:MAG: PSD1 and planctomycete cytochrome C domain-containing protein [Verrucomicrobiota bacterium]